MIYINKGQATEITTDNIVNFVPDNLEVYLDDVLVGTFVNYSTSELYLKFMVLAVDIAPHQSREYKLKIYTHHRLIKEELVAVKDNSVSQVKTITNQKSIKFYEPTISN